MYMYVYIYIQGVNSQLCSQFATHSLNRRCLSGPCGGNASGARQLHGLCEAKRNQNGELEEEVWSPGDRGRVHIYVQRERERCEEWYLYIYTYIHIIDIYLHMYRPYMYEIWIYGGFSICGYVQRYLNAWIGSIGISRIRLQNPLPTCWCQVSQWTIWKSSAGSIYGWETTWINRVDSVMWSICSQSTRMNRY